MNIKRERHTHKHTEIHSKDTSNCSFSKFNIFIIIAIRCALSAYIFYRIWMGMVCCMSTKCIYVIVICVFGELSCSELFFCHVEFASHFECIDGNTQTHTPAKPSQPKWWDRISINFVCVIYRKLIKLSTLGFNFTVDDTHPDKSHENRMDDNFPFRNCPCVDTYLFSIIWCLLYSHQESLFWYDIEVWQ